MDVFICVYMLQNQGKKRSEMLPLERSWRWGRTFLEVKLKQSLYTPWRLFGGEEV
jgi:hypothetical protein